MDMTSILPKGVILSDKLWEADRARVKQEQELLLNHFSFIVAVKAVFG